MNTTFLPLGFSTAAIPPSPGWYWMSTRYKCGTCWTTPEPTRVVPSSVYTPAGEPPPLVLFADRDEPCGTPHIKPREDVAWGVKVEMQ